MVRAKKAAEKSGVEVLEITAKVCCFACGSVYQLGEGASPGTGWWHVCPECRGMNVNSLASERYRVGRGL